MSDKDVDAQFADIVAHWDDVPTLPDRTLPAETVEAADSTADRPADSAAERAVVNDPPTAQPNPVNPPPTGPFVVWRGADQTPADDHPEPAELPTTTRTSISSPGPPLPCHPRRTSSSGASSRGSSGVRCCCCGWCCSGPSVSGWWTLAALGLTVGGFVLLVLRQPDSRVTRTTPTTEPVSSAPARARRSTQTGRWSLAATTSASSSATSSPPRVVRPGDAKMTSRTASGAPAGKVGRPGETSRSGPAMRCQAGPGLALVEVAGQHHALTVRQRTQDLLGMPQPLSGVQAEVDRRDHDRRAPWRPRRAPRHTRGCAATAPPAAAGARPAPPAPATR